MLGAQKKEPRISPELLILLVGPAGFEPATKGL